MILYLTNAKEGISEGQLKTRLQKQQASKDSTKRPSVFLLELKGCTSLLH